MISARQDIANGTRESISEWGFTVLLVYPAGMNSVANVSVKANGRKSSTDVDSEGVPIVNNNPYLSISVLDLGDNVTPDKGCVVQTPANFFTPGDPEKWWAVQRASKTDDDWFVKIYLTATEQVATS